MMGLANIATGLIYQLPMPIEPMKVLAVVAIAQRWSPSMIYASGLAMGAIWLLFGLTGVMSWIARITPLSITRGIQISLGALLAIEAVKLILPGWWLGIIAVVIVIVLRNNRYAPAAIVLIALGIILMAFRGELTDLKGVELTLPHLVEIRLEDIWPSMLQAGFAQIPLTATNAVIATSVLIKKYWPERPVSENRLALNMGVMNLLFPFFGGMPLCHGAGGLVGQYYFGARTGGTNIIEGLIEISMGLFLAGSIASLFSAFPSPIIGAMMFLVGIELMKFARDMHWNWELVPMAATVAVSLIVNMAFGFLAGMIIHYLFQGVDRLRRR